MYDGNSGEIDFGSSQREARVSEGSSYRESTVFHQFLDCILLGFLNHYKGLYIYGLVRSIHLQVLVIYQWPCGCPKHHHPNLFRLFCSFSFAVFWLIIGPELENQHYVLLDSICPMRSRQPFPVIQGFQSLGTVISSHFNGFFTHPRKPVVDKQISSGSYSGIK